METKQTHNGNQHSTVDAKKSLNNILILVNELRSAYEEEIRLWFVERAKKCGDDLSCMHDVFARHNVYKQTRVHEYVEYVAQRLIPVIEKLCATPGRRHEPLITLYLPIGDGIWEYRYYRTRCDDFVKFARNLANDLWQKQVISIDTNVEL